MSVLELEKLFSAIASHDFTGARLIASNLAELEAKRGHHSAARRLRGALTPNNVGPNIEGQFVTSSTLLSSALLKPHTDASLDDAILDESQRWDLHQIAAEWKQKERLFKAGIEPRRKILFSGPPGCGKSFCARALGLYLGLPVYVVKFDTIIGAYLGQTALHIRELFRFAETNLCLLLIDEIDAIGRQRGRTSDVGELDRIVISLLQELEHSIPRGLIIATSNLPEVLDPALLRRFQATIAFPRPSKVELRTFVEREANKHRFPFSKIMMPSILKAKSYAEAKNLFENQIRASILQYQHSK